MPSLTYLDNEPLGRVNTVSLYRERYRLLTSSDAPLGNRATVTWADGAQVPLCLLTPDMQNRRIIDELLRGAGGACRSDQFDDRAVRACAHRTLGERDAGEACRNTRADRAIRAIPIVAPEAVHTIGLVVPAREPMTPLTAALVAEAQRLAPSSMPGSAPRAWRTRASREHHWGNVFSRVVVPQRVVRASAPMQVAASAVNS